MLNYRTETRIQTVAVQDLVVSPVNGNIKITDSITGEVVAIPVQYTAALSSALQRVAGHTFVQV